MSKRAASYDIDEHTYEEKEKLREAGDSIDDEGKHLTNRKIFKIRKQDGTEPRAGSGNVDLKIKGFDNNDDKKPKEEIKVPQNPFKLNLFGQSQGVGLFTNVLSTPSASSGPSLFGTKPATSDNDSKQPAKPASGSLFDFKKPQNGNLFANNSLFSSTTGSLFGNPQSSSILFGASTSNFPSTNLFGNKLAGPITAPPEEDSGDSQELEKDQQMVVDPSKSEVKFDYGAQDDILQKVLVTKYKKDKGNLVEDVEAIIKHDSEKEIYSLIIRLASTKNIIYTGILLPQKSAVKRNNENLDVLAFTLSEKKHLEANRIKLQIKGQDKKLDDFYQELEKIIDSKSQEKSA